MTVGGSPLPSSGAPSIVRAQTAITFAVPNPSALTWLPYWVAVGEGYFGEEGPYAHARGDRRLVGRASGDDRRTGPDRRPGPRPDAWRARPRRGREVPLQPLSEVGLRPAREGRQRVSRRPTDLTGTVIGVGTADGAEVSFTSAIMTDLGHDRGHRLHLPARR